ncbi:MAG: 4-hydroxy-3-methylbut-2-enyl diphosphate reductase [Deltaproteobacteria bacterium]|nr:4-hydroxy-3-methylbut-2-enyl diphosphate reductase [Deltaproteobacteria bacterium]
MKVILAKTAGFCMGVRRAMEMVMAESNKKEGPLFTFGPLIHNKQVLDLLEAKGIKATDDTTGLSAGRILIRAHGIPPRQREMLQNSGLKVIDATCPKVTRVQAIIRHQSNKDRSTIIVGDKDHAEVIGLMGYSKNPAHLIEKKSDVANLPQLERPFVVAQTTQDAEDFKEIVAALQVRFPDIQVFDTICDATHERQAEVRTFKSQVEGVVVVGGYHSANTQRLAKISEEEHLPTFHVETEKELPREALSRMKIIGLTAGASTPHWLIKNVMQEIEAIQAERETPFVHGVRLVFRFLMLSNLAAAVGAFSFAGAVMHLAGGRTGLVFPLMATLYIYAMHVFNRFLDKGAASYNDPDRAAFQREHKPLLILMGSLAMGTALILSIIAGFGTFMALVGLSLLGVVYSIPLIPEGAGNRYRFVKIKDIPGSRSLSEALAWVAVMVFLPLFSHSSDSLIIVFVTAIVVFSFSYARAILFSLFQLQGDLMVGTETLPITLGEKRTISLFKKILLGTALLLVFSSISGLVSPIFFMMLIPLLTLLLCLYTYEKQWLSPGIVLEGLVEGNFLLAGIVVLM